MRGGGVDAVHNKAQPISAGNTELEIRLEVEVLMILLVRCGNVGCSSSDMPLFRPNLIEPLPHRPHQGAPSLN
jgi:hypothetical protein